MLPPRTWLVVVVVLQIMTVVGLAVGWLVGADPFGDRGHDEERPSPSRKLACEAIPVRFILDEPACAEKLLRSMNSSVRVLANASDLRLPHTGSQ